MKKTKIAIIGLGTVGGGTYKILTNERQRLEKQYGVDLIVAGVSDTRREVVKQFSIPESIFTTDYKQLITNKEIDIVVELVGGTTIAGNMVREALQHGKHVVTANKALLADQGDALFSLADEKNRTIGFEASVCGGIPVIGALRDGLAANGIVSIFGILNGTANYILTKMRFDKMSFKNALVEAQRLGFAEADPTSDVEGIDSANKLAILSSMAFGRFYHRDSVYVEGITEITDLDIAYAGEMGFVIKLLGVAKLTKSGVPSLSVAPTLIPADEIIAEVNHEYNGVFIEGNFVGHTLYTGKGAGSLPTGSAVVSDVIRIASMPNGASPAYGMHYKKEKGVVLPFDENEAEYYLRLTAADKPGVMARISGELGNRSISIAMLMQKETTADGNAVIVIQTHKTTHGQIVEAVKSLSSLDIVSAPIIKFRIIRDLYTA